MVKVVVVLDRPHYAAIIIYNMMELSLVEVLDYSNLNAGHVVTIEENENADASFLFGSLLSECVLAKRKIILILFHHTLGHYHGIGMKLGFNLMEYKNTKKMLNVIDFSSKICAAGCDDLKCHSILKEIASETETILSKEKHNPVTIFLEHPSNLIISGVERGVSFSFGIYMRAFVEDNVNLVTLLKVLPGIKELSVFSAIFQFYSTLFAQVFGLETGAATDISGRLVLRKLRENSLTHKEDAFHYRLLDKRIRLFAPGHLQMQ